MGRIRARAVVSAVLMAVVVTLTAGACGGSDASSQVGRPTSAEQLRAAKAKVDAATSMHLVLHSSGIAASVNGILGADGSGTHAPAFKGTLDVRFAGFRAKVEVVSVDRLLYLKLPFSNAFVPADPKQYHAPDPARLFDKTGGIGSLLTATTNPVQGKPIGSGGAALTTITGTLPGASVVRLLNLGDATKTFHATYGITDPGGELRSVTVVGPFYKGATSTYTLTLDRYGAPVQIGKP